MSGSYLKKTTVPQQFSPRSVDFQGIVKKSDVPKLNSYLYLQQQIEKKRQENQLKEQEKQLEEQEKQLHKKIESLTSILKTYIMNEQINFEEFDLFFFKNYNEYKEKYFEKYKWPTFPFTNPDKKLFTENFYPEYYIGENESPINLIKILENIISQGSKDNFSCIISFKKYKSNPKKSNTKKSNTKKSNTKKSNTKKLNTKKSKV